MIGIDLGPFERCTVVYTLEPLEPLEPSISIFFLDLSWLSAPGGMTTVCLSVAWENPQPNPSQPC